MKFDLQFLKALELAVLFVGLYVAEHIVPARKMVLSKKHDLVNMLIGAMNLITVFSGGYFLQKLLAAGQSHHFGLLNLFFIPRTLHLMLQVIFIDLVMYWWHRINHLIPLFWRFHKFHHTDEQMNITTTLRFHPVEQLLSSLMKLALYPLLGLTALGVVVYGFLFFPVILIHHSNISVSEKADRIYRKLFVSPLMHRTHHSRIKKETDSNYGSVFPFWDRLFKSYTKKPSAPVNFGVE
jgi:sterol desaturase/sphingolipid hydroxylase (fatty acid hydroxylase superfamily)